jgi:glycine/D-amino acid oxidase-like deaminating enzyme
MQLGVQFYEHTPVSQILRHTDIFHLKTPKGSVSSKKLVLTTNAYSLLIPLLRRKQVPVWTYIVLTEPLRVGRLPEIDWKGREGVEDYRDLVHYYRLTSENRLLMGGRDVGITFGSNMNKDLNERVFTLLEHDIVAIFPSLKGIKITDRWGGPVSVTIDMTLALGYLGDKRAVYSLGCVGHGVSMMHLNGQVLADLLLERKSQWTESFPVNHRFTPWPPEPIRYIIGRAVLGYMHAEDAWAERKGWSAPTKQ